MQTLLVVIVSILGGIAVAAEPAVLTGKAVSVHDGDTLTAIDPAQGSPRRAPR